MRVLISGVCGFVGSHLARFLIESRPGVVVVGVDNLARAGSETNRASLKRLGVQLFHGDIRMPSDLEMLPACDWVIDAAAMPSVLAGRDGRTSSRQLLEHNLLGTINILEYCRASGAGLILLSTSRVYSIRALVGIPMCARDGAFHPDESGGRTPSLSAAGIRETFSTEAPVSLYGATKLASEQLALEYAAAFQLPVCINRCGVLAGAGQFGTAEQGIFSYWLHAHRARRPLKYLGFGGTGHQVRDALHPRDLARFVSAQLDGAANGVILNLSGGAENSMSLAQLTNWCDDRFGAHAPMADGTDRPYDIPWLVLDSASATKATGWKPEVSLLKILEELAQHADSTPDWLSVSGA